MGFPKGERRQLSPLVAHADSFRVGDPIGYSVVYDLCYFLSMSQKPHLTVAAVVENAGRFLMVEEEADGRVVYNQPAGHLDDGETLAQGVARETLEETAWHFQPEAIVGIYRWSSSTNGITYVRVCFSGRCHVYEPDRTLDSGIRRALWLTRAEVSALGDQLRSPMVLLCIDDYLAGKTYSLSLITELT